MDHAFRRLPHSTALVAAVLCLAHANVWAAVRPRAGGSPVVQPAPQAPQTPAGPGLWHVVESSVDPEQRPAILRGSRSIWCGKYNPCWAISVGYPNLAYEILYVDTGNHIDDYTLNLNMIASLEVFYDYMYLIGGGAGATDPIGNDRSVIDEVIALGSSGNARLLAAWTGSIHGDTAGASSIDTTPPVTITGNGSQPDSLTADIFIDSGHRALYFVFSTDCLYSPQDGLWPFGNGVLFDDLSTSDNGAIYTDAAAAGGTDSFGGSVIVGTGGAPIVSSRGIFRLDQPSTITPPSNQTMTEGAPILLTATATDPDAADINLHLSAVGYPSGLTLTTSIGNPASATLSGTLSCGTAAQSPYTIVWCVSSHSYDVTATSVLTVAPDPLAPAVTAPSSLTRAVGSIVFFNVYATGGSGFSWTADLTDLPPGNNANFSLAGVTAPANQAGSFTWTLLTGNEGDYDIRFTASNGRQGCAVTHIHVVPGGVTDVALGGPISAAVLLGQNRPNPFNPETSIRISLPRETRVVLDIFDVQGRRVVRLLDVALPAGPRDVHWDGRDASNREVPTGVYLYRMEAGGASLSRRMMLLR